MTATKWIVAAGIALTLLSVAGVAQAPKAQQPQQPAQREPQEPVTWDRMPRMQLEASYAGPMKDTTIQRWRDPGLNVVCYLYVPFTAQHSPPTATGYVQYGPNIIGNISCVPVIPSAPAKPAPTAKVTPPHTPAKQP
jgi:hypothetical protein